MGAEAAGRTRGWFRSVHASMIDDPDYQLLTHEARHTLLTARICDAYGVAGIFRFYPEVLAKQTGLDLKHLLGAIFELQEADWARMDGASNVLWIVNGLRYDPQVSLDNIRQRAAILNQLRSLPRTPLLGAFLEHYRIDPPEDLAERVAATPRPPDGDSDVRDQRKSDAREDTDTLSEPVNRTDDASPKSGKPEHSHSHSHADEDGRAGGPAQPAFPGLESFQGILEHAAAAARDRSVVHAERTKMSLDVWEAWAASMPMGADAKDPGAGDTARFYIASLEDAVEAFFADTAHGASFTPARRREFARRMSKYSPAVQLLAMEIYLDDYVQGGVARKDERVALGIARRLGRLSPDELDKNTDEHRAKHGSRGVFASPTPEASK